MVGIAMKSPLVTVGIPLYNHASYIKEAIGSALTQEGIDLEVIVVDDASNDQSAAIAEAVSSQDARVRVIRNSFNRGPSLTFDTILREARGKYICPLPSDDAFVEGKLAKQVALMESFPELALVATGAKFIDEAGQEIFQQSHFAASLFDTRIRDRAGWLRYFFNVGNCICASGQLVRTDVFRKFSPDARLMQLQDYDSWVRMALAGLSIGMIDEPLIRYRILGQQANLSAPTKAVRARNLYEHIKVLERFYLLSSLEDLVAITRASLGPPPSGVSEYLYVQHHLSLHAWGLARPQHRCFALDNWYRLLGDATWQSELDILGVNARFLAEKTAMNPLATAVSGTFSGQIRKVGELILPSAVRNALARKIKLQREG